MFVVSIQISRYRLRPRSHGTGSVWSRHLVQSVYGHIYSYHVLIKFCNIIKNLRVMLVLRLFKLIWYHTEPVPCERGLRLTPQTSFYPEYIPLRQNIQPDCFFLVASLLKVSAKDLCVALTTSSNVTRGNVSSMLSTW